MNFVCASYQIYVCICYTILKCAENSMTFSLKINILRRISWLQHNWSMAQWIESRKCIGFLFFQNFARVFVKSWTDFFCYVCISLFFDHLAGQSIQLFTREIILMVQQKKRWWKMSWNLARVQTCRGVR